MTIPQISTLMVLGWLLGTAMGICLAAGGDR